jgi:hypothetical protein
LPYYTKYIQVAARHYKYKYLLVQQYLVLALGDKNFKNTTFMVDKYIRVFFSPFTNPSKYKLIKTSSTENPLYPGLQATPRLVPHRIRVPYHIQVGPPWVMIPLDSLTLIVRQYLYQELLHLTCQAQILLSTIYYGIWNMEYGIWNMEWDVGCFTTDVCNYRRLCYYLATTK